MYNYYTIEVTPIIFMVTLAYKNLILKLVVILYYKQNCRYFIIFLFENLVRSFSFNTCPRIIWKTITSNSCNKLIKTQDNAYRKEHITMQMHMTIWNKLVKHGIDTKVVYTEFFQLKNKFTYRFSTTCLLRLSRSGILNTYSFFFYSSISTD